MSRWLITNMRLANPCQNQRQHKGFTVHFDGDFLKAFPAEGLRIGIDGYVLPRESCPAECRPLKNEELIRRLFAEKGPGLIDFVKGIFVILLVSEQGFFLFNDHHSIKKFFIHQDGGGFLIAGELSLIAGAVRLRADAERAALFCLMTHFIAGTTLFRSVEASGPATAVRFNGSLKIDRYWLPDELLSLKERKISIAELADVWRGIIGRHVEYLKPSALTVTLTGGMDSRMILAALLSLGIRPNAFTFGDPRSLDAMTASKVAASRNLNYHCHSVGEPGADWFARRGKEVIALGSSLLHIHRAHRLDAIEREMESNPANELILVGDMGGEYIQGVAYHDYIISKLVRLWRPGDESGNKETMRRILRERHFKAGETDLDEVHSILAAQPFIQQKGKHGHFHVEFYVDAALHHTQDMNLYMKRLKYVACPFMDIDWLEAIFSSPFHMPLGDYVPERGHLLENWRQNLRLGVTHLLAPQLSNIAYGKRGFYSAREYLGSKILLLLKRTYRYMFLKNGTPSFPYRKWIADFSWKSIEGFSEESKQFVDMERYRNDLARPVHGQEEGYWHDFTNLINIDYIIKEFVK